jgi:hypothetical protein
MSWGNMHTTWLKPEGLKNLQNTPEQKASGNSTCEKPIFPS